MNNSLLSPEINLGVNPCFTFYEKSETESYDSLFLDISTDNWSSYYSYKITPHNKWYNHKKDLWGKMIHLRFRVESDESIPFDPYTCNGLFMIDELVIFSDRTVR